MVLLEVLTFPPPRSWGEGHGEEDRTKLGLEMVFLYPHPLALGPLSGRPVGRKPVSAFAQSQRKGRATLQEAWERRRLRVGGGPGRWSSRL